MKKSARGINPKSAHMYQRNGSRRSNKCRQMRKDPAVQVWVILQKMLLGLFFRSSIFDF